MRTTNANDKFGYKLSILGNGMEITYQGPVELVTKGTKELWESETCLNVKQTLVQKMMGKPKRIIGVSSVYELKWKLNIFKIQPAIIG